MKLIRQLLSIVLLSLIVAKICITEQVAVNLEELFRQAELEYKQSQVQRSSELNQRDTKSIGAIDNFHRAVTKTTEESRRNHDNFMIALRVAKKLRDENIDSIKVKSPPEFCSFSSDDPECTNPAKYRQIDGTCNNLESKLLGKSNTPFKRLLRTAYEDGVNEPRLSASDGSPLPNARLVALVVHHPLDTLAQISNLGVTFGQFVDHDFAHSAVTSVNGTQLKCTCDMDSPDCVNIPTPDFDGIDNDQICMALTRSAASFGSFDCELKAREQTNLLTHWLDLSQVYGSDSNQANKLRAFEGGRLKASSIPSVNKREFLPPTKPGVKCVDETDEQFCFESGDGRTNENLMLTSIHTVFLREHNRIARFLQRQNPRWTDENIYQEARRILIAQYQHILYKEWLPKILGENLYESNGLKPLPNGYFMDYDSDINPHVAAEFSTAAFRFGHSQLTSTLSRADPDLNEIDNLSLKDVSLRPTEAFQNGGLDSICRGLLINQGDTFDPYFTDQINHHLFEDTHEASKQTKRFSLPAVNIMRGRDHGLPPYVEFRRFVGLSEPQSFDDLDNVPIDVRENLKIVYNNVNDIDVFTGGTIETPMEGALLGPTFGTLVAIQFRDLKFGDRYYYENGNDENTRFKPDQLDEIRKSTMARLMCDNLDIKSIQQNAFYPPSDDNPLIECKFVKRVSLTKWKNEKLP